MKTPVLESLFNSEYCEIFKSTYFEEHLRTAASENMFMKLRNIKKIGFSTSASETSSWLVLHNWFLMKFILTYNIYLSKRRSKVQEKNMSCDCALNFDQWKNFSENSEFNYGLFTKLLRIIVARDFSPSSSKLSRGILPLLTKFVSLRENYLSYQAKIFLVNSINS